MAAFGFVQHGLKDRFQALCARPPHSSERSPAGQLIATIPFLLTGLGQVATDNRLHLFFVDIAALRYQLIADHDGRGRRQPQSGVFFGAILLTGFGCDLDFHFVLFPQPGDDFSEMTSGLAAGLV
jgi:hypothetical protein